MRRGFGFGRGRIRGSGSGVVDPSAGYALYLDFKNSLYRSGSTISTAPPELCGDPAFNGLGWWAADAGVAVTGGKGVWTATTGSLYKAVPLNIGTSYVVTYTIDSISGGSISVQGGTARAAPGTYTETIVSGFNYILFGGGGAAITAQIDNVSIKAVAGTVSTMPGYTYTRSGAKSELNGTASPVAFAANAPGIVPRIGYWSRAALTNLVLQSAAFDNAAWTQNSTTTTADAATAPDGTTTADKVVPTALNTGNHLVNQAATLTAATYTLSVFAKPAGYNFLVLQSNLVGGYVEFNISAGTFTVSGANYTATITAAGNGWYRCTATFTGTAASHILNHFVFAATGGPAYPGDATSGMYLWQSQCMLGNFPDGGPIIATTTAAASIGADALATATNPISADQDYIAWVVGNWRNTSEISASYLADFGLDRLFMGRDSANNARIGINGVIITSVGGALKNRVALLYRRKAGKDSIAVKDDTSTVTVGVETLRTWVAQENNLFVGTINGGGGQPGANVEGIFVQLGTFSDAQLTTILTAA